MPDYADRYGIPPEVEAWRARAERFARERLAPIARQADRDRRFPREIVPEMAAEGLIGAPLPREHGGGGVGALADALIAEEIGRVDGSVRGFLAVHVGLAARTIARHGTPGQRREWLPRMASGEAIGCFCLTEPGAGSDAASIATRALAEGDLVRITGEKTWITNARIAKVALVFASAQPDLGRRGLECYLVPTDTPGFLTEPMEGVELGHRASDHARVLLRDVLVPASARLGPPREGFRVAMDGLDHGRLNVAAGATGIQAACLDLAVEWSRARRQFGRRIGDFQQVGATLAETKVALEASRLLVHHAARRMDRGARATAETSAAKLFATEAAQRAATQALRIHGARGYTDALPLERHYRDAVALTIYEGTSEIQRVILARDLLGKDRSEETA